MLKLAHATFKHNFFPDDFFFYILFPSVAFQDQNWLLEKHIMYSTNFSMFYLKKVKKSDETVILEQIVAQRERQEIFS